MAESCLPADAYQSIEAVVQETERGRWFLAEFARRRREAELAPLLENLEKLGRTLAERPDSADLSAMRELQSMPAQVIADIGASVEATTSSVAQIMRAAERLRSISQGPREALTRLADEIENACAFQAEVGRRNRAILEAMHRFEHQVARISKASVLAFDDTPPSTVVSIAHLREMKAANESTRSNFDRH